MADAIQINGLIKSYGPDVVLQELDLRIPAGSVFGLIGPNGAGKSTLLGVLTGLLSYDDGYISVNGLQLGEENDEKIKKQMASVLQPPLLFEQFTGLEFIEYVCDIYGVKGDGFIEKAYSLLDYFEIKDFAKIRIDRLSSGSKKKLAFLTAVLTQPKILLLDEPFDSVDVISIERMKAIIRRLKETGCTIVITSHILEIIEHLCDDIAILHKGQIIAYLDAVNRKTLEGNTSLHEIFNKYVEYEEKNDDLEWL